MVRDLLIECLSFAGIAETTPRKIPSKMIKTRTFTSTCIALGLLLYLKIFSNFPSFLYSVYVVKRRTFLKLLGLGALGLPGCLKIDASDYLRVRNGEILSPSGAPVFLRGFNVAFRDFKTVLGEEDIKRIASLGGNVIRLWYEYTDFEAAPYEYRREGFALLDKILDWCGNHGVYLILCNHHAPGGQNPHDFVVRDTESYTFWEEAQNQERFSALWAELAKRYASRRIIAGYDLLNEGVPPSISAYRDVLNRAALAVRSYDENHILVVEEARLPSRNGQQLVLVPIKDENTLYSVHFFYPPQFTFYTTTNSRTVTTYPGVMSIAGETIDEARTPSITSSHDWKEFTLRASPPPGAEILLVKLVSRNNQGGVWFDDVQLKSGSDVLDLPAPLVSNPSFEISHSGFHWETKGTGVAVVNSEARTGSSSMMFSNTREAAAQSSPIAVKKGEYNLSAWVKADNATGDNHISLSWHKQRVVAVLNKGILEERLQYAINFKNSLNVPLLVGEFTAHANPSLSSVVNYLSDVLAIMEKHRLHWTYWSYYSHLPGIGLYTGNERHLSRPEALELLKKHIA